MKHNHAQRLLPAYADRQVGAFRRFLLRRHFASCPSCMAELESLHSMHTALRTNLTMYRAPPGLATRIGSALPREAPPLARPRRLEFGFAGGGFAGALAGVVLTLAVVRLTPAPDPLVADVLADHVRSMMAAHLTDVETSDRHTVKPWLSARLDLSPVVKDFAEEGYPLVGGRLDYVDGRRAAAIVYRRDKHIINLFALVSQDRSDSPPRQETRDGFNIVRWRMDGLTYVAVSDVEAPQLMAFVRMVQG